MESTPIFDAVVADQHWNPLPAQADEKTSEPVAAGDAAERTEGVADA